MQRGGLVLQTIRLYGVGRRLKRDVYKCTELYTGPTHIFLESLDPEDRPYGWQRYMDKQQPRQQQRLPRPNQTKKGRKKIVSNKH
jgi:hypothetical protein